MNSTKKGKKKSRNIKKKKTLNLKLPFRHQCSFRLQKKNVALNLPTGSWYFTESLLERHSAKKKIIIIIRNRADLSIYTDLEELKETNTSGEKWKNLEKKKKKNLHNYKTYTFFYKVKQEIAKIAKNGNICSGLVVLSVYHIRKKFCPPPHI